MNPTNNARYNATERAYQYYRAIYRAIASGLPAVGFDGDEFFPTANNHPRAIKTDIDPSAFGDWCLSDTTEDAFVSAAIESFGRPAW